MKTQDVIMVIFFGFLLAFLQIQLGCEPDFDDRMYDDPCSQPGVWC